jgi:hypothetical protein
MGKRKVLKETDVDMDDAKRPATQDSSESEDVFWTPSSLLKIEVSFGSTTYNSFSGSIAKISTHSLIF